MSGSESFELRCTVPYLAQHLLYQESKPDAYVLGWLFTSREHTSSLVDSSKSSSGSPAASAASISPCEREVPTSFGLLYEPLAWVIASATSPPAAEPSQMLTILSQFGNGLLLYGTAGLLSW